MADVPAGAAWYGRQRVWAQPARLKDFYAITVDQPMGELLLTPLTLDRPFFSELALRGPLPGSLGGVTERFGEWGQIYSAFLTGKAPPEFPLTVPQKLAENLYVLFNPALPPPRWSQAAWEVIATGEFMPTLIFNGYGEFVAGLYDNMQGEKLFM